MHQDVSASNVTGHGLDLLGLTFLFAIRCETFLGLVQDFIAFLPLKSAFFNLSGTVDPLLSTILVPWTSHKPSHKILLNRI
jgi:hypothetical protein